MIGGAGHAVELRRPLRTLSKATATTMKVPTNLIDLINGKKVEPVIYTGLDECTQENIATCIAK
ncbi:MAG TPA: hypothetical protein VJZ73_05200 [Methylomirabilota bacterium]|nr:hypothetical protein [Methylomirabilota bacterium]